MWRFGKEIFPCGLIYMARGWSVKEIYALIEPMQVGRNILQLQPIGEQFIKISVYLSMNAMELNIFYMIFNLLFMNV